MLYRLWGSGQRPAVPPMKFNPECSAVQLSASSSTDGRPVEMVDCEQRATHRQPFIDNIQLQQSAVYCTVGY